MKEETKNLYVAIILSMFIIFGVNHFLAPKVSQPTKKQIEVQPEIKVVQEETKANLPLDDILNIDERVLIKTPSVQGSIRLKGARFDFLELTKYKETIEKDSPNVKLLAPAGSLNAYFAEFGFLSTNPLNVPNADSIWKNMSGDLTISTPLVLTWNNGSGLNFIRQISIDEHYMLTISDTVQNQTDKNVTLYPFGRINRIYDPKNVARSVVHEGVTGVIDGSAKEIKLKDVKEKDPKKFEASDAWFGFSDRYWLTAFILDAKDGTDITVSNNGDNNYQVDFRVAQILIPAGGTRTQTVKFFAGAKEIKLLDKYTKGGIKKFDLAVDFGWYYFLTKPFFYILDFLYKIIGNMGWAILLFAALLRLVMFPVANKSYESMSKMKKIQPKVLALQEQYKGNKVLLQQKTMELYKREKINPASGCLPLFIQIPVFFSLYKVLNIAIEIRHAPFIGWVKDLSAPDPLTISAWSHVPLPAVLDIGVWPILMG